MKKIAMLLVAAAMVLSASAQRTATTGSKFGDNWYVGVNAGAATPTLNYSWMNNITPNIGVRVGKNLTTVFGVAAEANVYGYSQNEYLDQKCAVDKINVSLLGTMNLSNLFCGYKGEPRFFEVIGLYGLGWGHNFGRPAKELPCNEVNAKVGVDFALNLGKDKEWQVYAEPALIYNLGVFPSYVTMKHDLSKSMAQLNIGVNYKFGCSNGTHNFAIEQVRDQAEIDALNAKINGLRADVDAANAKANAKDAEIARLKKALQDCENKPAPVVEAKVANLQPTVIFRQGKSVVDKSQMANIELIANYMKNHEDATVKISGYASPEGPKALNQKLSENRAEAVKNILVKKYGISADRLVTEGLGATDKLFNEVEFNRVALFNDTTK